MTERATGLVVRVRPLTETSLIIHWLSPTVGRFATVAKGARRPASPFRGRLDLFYLVDLSFGRSRTSELHNLREVSVRETHGFLRQNIGYLQQAAYCINLVEQTTETETPLGNVFQLVLDFLKTIPQHQPEARTVFGFELKLLTELGLQPGVEQSHLSKGAKLLVEQFQRADWGTLSRLRLSADQTRELSQFLHGFMVYHLGRVPKGREAAIQPLESKR
jgi:DNA repair protein RecO (recombination protein O)